MGLSRTGKHADLMTSAILEDPQATFPDWRIWRSSAGHLWTIRNGHSSGLKAHGLAHVVDIARLAEKPEAKEAL